MYVSNVLFQTFDECKQIMLERGLLFLQKLEEARGKIVKLAGQFIIDGSVCIYVQGTGLCWYGMMMMLCAARIDSLSVTCGATYAEGGG